MASRLSKAQLRTLYLRESLFEGTLFVCAAFSVLVTVAIVVVLVYESAAFFRQFRSRPF